MIEIIYVGKKPWTRDNVAGSGKAWDGPGDVQEVTENQAKVLLKYPDQWALANEKDAEKVGGPVTVAVTDTQTGVTTDVPATVLAKPYEKMNKAELVTFGASIKLALDPAMSKKAMIDAIEEAQKGPEPLQPGVAP
ncbi:hypothetical protein ACUXAV_000309 [Cupriavidus metallidurans]|uniref:hypothetical protein n=1 Tax=Cupriavidus metallidurans TaxID=119219 RepID=UPI000492F276|nr:hypothetical protein [Cupriavidus metallidurans]MDE4918270.1 hypothetical protein [Cupriavidus metallidurans]